MLTATPEETDDVRSYMEWQAPDLTVEFLQKVYSENVLSTRHDVWDVHTNVDRWWVITSPTNLYSQTQFPNMDLALTFHVGLCLRMPRSERQQLNQLPIEPFAECCRYMQEASEAVQHSEEVADYQAIGVRCREALIAFTNVAQVLIPWASDDEKPKRADFKAWVEHICGVVLAGETQKDRRRLFKSLLISAWDFANWLTHTKSSKWHDAEASAEATNNAISLCLSSVIQHIRGVPSACPACGSHKLTPERAHDPNFPSLYFERPTCTKCDWKGETVKIKQAPTGPVEQLQTVPETECIIPTVPLRRLDRPGEDQ